MDVRELKKIVQIMNDNDLAEVVVEEEGRMLKVRKHESRAADVVAAATPAPAVAPAPAPPQPAGEEPAPAKEDSDLHEITAPMVGTFYSAPSPDSAPYVENGASVNAETVVCILEAMKVMNEIKSECSGTIAEICVENGQAVDYGQPLFKVRKS